MTILNIPIRPITNQSLNVVLNGQNCTIDLLTRGGHTFLNLFVDNQPIVQGRKLSLTKIVPYKYLQTKFIGNLILLNSDLNIKDNPEYIKFGTTQLLFYYQESDLT
jgi:hypothetical protein